MDEKIVAVLQQFQTDELTDHKIYAHMSRRVKGDNGRILARMAEDEARHAAVWYGYTGKRSRPTGWKVILFMVLFRIFGLTFVINLLEKGEDAAAEKYKDVLETIPETLKVIEDENRHEQELTAMLDEEKLRYIGSMILGLNDALVELTGALAGFTLALGSNKAVGLAGFITGVAATLSMAASEYLSKKSDSHEKHPLKAAIYTGIAYLLTVALLLFPYSVTDSPFLALAFCLFNAACIIFVFTFFVSVVKREPFLPKLVEMLTISFSVAVVSFVIGWLAKEWLGIEL